MPQKTLITTKQTAILTQIERELARDPRLKSHNTRRGYRTDLQAFEVWRNGRATTKLLVEEYAAMLQDAGKAPNTINRALASIRWWVRKVGDLSYEDSTLTRETREEITIQAARVASIEDVTGTRKQKGRHISTGELDALMTVCGNDQTTTGARDAAITALAWVTGARRSELASLTLEDWTQTEPEAGEITIRGKGDKTRDGFIEDGALDALQDWLTIRGSEPGPLFYAIRKGGHVQIGKSLSGESLSQTLAKRQKQAKISKKTTWHDFRRTFAGNLLDGGTDLVTVSKLMGHSTPGITAMYDRRGKETQRRAIKTLHVPYRKRTLDQEDA